MAMELILGSQSPRRRELLERMGLRFRVLTADIDETKFETEDPEASVRRICEAKARAVAGRLRKEASADGKLILSSDTIVVLDGRILGKPHDEAGVGIAEVVLVECDATPEEKGYELVCSKSTMLSHLPVLGYRRAGAIDYHSALGLDESYKGDGIYDGNYIN